MAGPLSPFRPSVPATNDPNRLGLPFCQPSGDRSYDTFTDPFRIPCPLPCGNYGRGGRCRQRLLFQLSMGRVRPTGGRALIRSIPRRQRLSLKARTSILNALSSMAALPPPCPSRACSRKLRRARAMPRPGARIRSTSLRIMVDAIGADGAPTDHPSGDGPLVCNVAALLDDIATFGLSPMSTVAASVVTSAPEAT